MKDLFNRRTNPVLGKGPLEIQVETTLLEFAMKTERGERRFSFLNAGSSRRDAAKKLETKGYVESLFVTGHERSQINISGDLTQKGIDYVNEHIFTKR